VQAFVDLFERAGKFIISHPDESAKITAEWLLTSESVERRSLPTIKFLSHYTDEWNRGVDLWVKSLNARGSLTGDVKKGVETDTVGDVLYDNRFYNKLEE
jgi:ABC-type nitrate/sulfonate/bicarbonate transport system substrate-binding protein